ncbi:hypothetical protein [Bradyrhizobium sp. S3.9.1]|uniref:hypothetical protein n=1 Tax=Bradyrhizobium sp. S3.9.1 TaxID=3156431 RepID=UPI003394DB3F
MNKVITQGQIARIEIDESAAICVEQIDDEITVAIASVVGVRFQVTADQALELSRALAVAAADLRERSAQRALPSVAASETALAIDPLPSTKSHCCPSCHDEKCRRPS